jgi:hypothetical protein
MSELKQKIEDLNLKEKWSKFTLKLDQIPVPKWVLVIITFVSVVVAIVSLVSGGSNTNDSTSTNIKKSEETINVKVQFEAGGSDYINVRTSGYSNFYADKVPTGKCDVVGIISYYEFSSEPYQLYIRDREDIIKLD